VVSGLLYASISGGSSVVVRVVVRVKEEVVLVLRAIASVVVIVELEAIVRITLFVIINILFLLILLVLIRLLYFPERVFISFIL